MDHFSGGRPIDAVPKVPLPEDPSALLDYEDLVAFERSGIREFPVRLQDGSTKQVNIASVLDGIVTREARMAEYIDPIEDKASRRSDPPPQQHDAQASEPTADWERVAIFAIGVAFVAILLAIALFVPDPSGFQIFIFRVVLALAAGALGALIPGFIEVRFRNWLRAGGATALFVIVYLINPPALVTESPPSPERPAMAAPQIRD